MSCSTQQDWWDFSKLHGFKFGFQHDQTQAKPVQRETPRGQNGPLLLLWSFKTNTLTWEEKARRKKEQRRWEREDLPSLPLNWKTRRVGEQGIKKWLTFNVRFLYWSSICWTCPKMRQTVQLSWPWYDKIQFAGLPRLFQVLFPD